MCFYISDKKSEKKQRIAKKDLLCFKYGTRHNSESYVSPIQGYPYEAGKIVRGKLQRPRYGKIDIGFHSYHSITGIRWHGRINKSIGLFIIPKGSKYYTATDTYPHLYVSNKIKFVRFLTRQEKKDERLGKEV